MIGSVHYSQSQSTLYSGGPHDRLCTFIYFKWQLVVVCWFIVLLALYSSLLVCLSVVCWFVCCGRKQCVMLRFSLFDGADLICLGATESKQPVGTEI